MDSEEIATGILSLTTQDIVGWDKSEPREMSRRATNTRRLFAAPRRDSL
jgi:hypothetical protein